MRCIFYSFAAYMISIELNKNNKEENVILYISNTSTFLQKTFGKRAASHHAGLIENISDKAISIGIITPKNETNFNKLELLRKESVQAFQRFNALKASSIFVCFENSVSNSQKTAVCEALMLASYQFLYLKSDIKKHQNSVQKISIEKDAISKKELEELINTCEAVCITRDLVNWPQRNQTANDLANSFKDLAKKAGFNISVLSEAKIASMKMGGLLAVNQGSHFPPTFSIMEWKPEKAKNKKPIVLVGKGIVYDTGGLSIKSMPGMATMKCDIHGAATVGGLMYSIAKNKLPLHVVALVPATDNWVSAESYAPGDVITMYDGTTVEILNTDAEGRLVLADALHYAKKYKPEMVFDFATLTGAAVRAIGDYGTVCMGNIDKNIFDTIKESGNQTFERLVEMPLWDEYKEELKSDIADMTNLGKGEGGSQSAGKFLEHFTDYPWVHFDIAGPSFLDKPSAYRPKGATGVGVRMLYHFLKTNYKL